MGIDIFVGWFINIGEVESTELKSPVFEERL